MGRVVAVPPRLRHRALTLALTLCVVGASVLAAKHAASARATRTHHHAHPNIVLILTDDQRFDMLWAMPHVRKLISRHGVTFRNGFVVNSLCCPSRASILTGKYSHGTDVYKNNPPHGGFQSFDDHSTIATWLDHAGYETALIGKYLNGYGSTGHYIPPGWDHWLAYRAPLRYYNYSLIDRHEQLHYGADPQDYATNVLADAAVNFIRGARKPFFLYWAPYSPHLPAVPAPRDRGKFGNLGRFKSPNFGEADVSDKPEWVQELPRFDAGERGYARQVRRIQYQTIQSIDRAVGAIVGALDRKGVLHKTMIVFMSDNGLMWGEHRMTALKEVPYEESIRVPLVIRYDPITHRKRADRHFALNIDLAPTFAALAGVRAPGVEGRSLLPLLRRRAKSWRTDFLIEHLKGEHPPPTYCAVRNRRYLYVLYGTGEEELYDLSADPYELRNAANEPDKAAVKAQLHERMMQLCNPPPPKFDPVTGQQTPASVVTAPSPSPSPSPTA